MTYAYHEIMNQHASLPLHYISHRYSRYTLCTTDSEKTWTYSRHPSIHHKVGPINETAFIASEEEHSLGLLNGFTESPRRKVDFATVAFGGIVAEPVLEEGRAGL